MKVVLFSYVTAVILTVVLTEVFEPPTQEQLDFYRKFEKQHGQNVDCTGNHTFYQYTDCDQRCDYTPPSNDCPGASFIGCDACKEGYIPVDNTRKQCVLPGDCPKPQPTKLRSVARSKNMKRKHH